MDGFSVASVTSLCTSISNRSAAGIGELQSLIQSLPSTEAFAKLHNLLASFTGLNQHVTETETALNNAQVISEQLQEFLKQYLTSCDGAVGVVGKQLMRLQADNIHQVDWSVVETYRFTLTTYTNLFTFLVTLLQIDQREAQDASLNTARNVVAQAENLSRMASNANGILKDQTEAMNTASSSKDQTTATKNTAASEGNDEPPPYEAAPSVSQPGLSSQALPSQEAGPSSSSGGFNFSIITDSLRAVASSLSSKPEPLVSALCQAAGQADLQQVRGLLSQGANINGRNEEGHNALQCAILANRVDSVRFLLDAGAGLKGSGWSSTPPLFFAAAAGSIDVAKVFLERGDNVRAKDVSGQPYFSTVLSKQSVEGVKLLLENGANANATDVSGQPMLAKAVSRSNVEIATLLLDHGANPNKKSNSGSSLLSNAAAKEDYAMVDLLLERGSSPDSKSINGTTVLSDAIGKRRVDFAKMLLSRGADGNTKDVVGEHVLITTVRDTKMEEQDRIDLVWLLLEHGAPATASDSIWSVPAMCHAVERGNADIAALLLQYGAKATSRMNNEKLPLLHAIDRGRVDLVRMLLWHGVDVNKKDGNKRTAMMAATARQDSEILQLLSHYNEGSHRSSGNPLGLIQRPTTLESLKSQPPSRNPVYYVGSQAQATGQGSSRPHSPPPGYDFKGGN